MQAPIRFGVFELDLDRIELRKAGTLLRMRPQALKLLALLTAYAGELVTREKIRAELWDSETTVDFEQGINRCIREIRSALDDDADTPRYIKTVHRRGYIFIAPVHGITRPPELKHEIKQSQLTTHSHEASITALRFLPVVHIWRTPTTRDSMSS